MALGSPRFWAWVALSTLPPDFFGLAFHWSLAEPAGIAAALLWWPADVLGRLGALRLLVASDAAGAAPPGGLRPLRAAFVPALGAEILATLRATVWLFLGELPCLAALSLASPASLFRTPERAFLLTLAFLGALPAAAYLLRRCLSPLELLLAPLTAGESLEASARRLGWGRRLGRFLALAWPWIGMSWGLDALGLLLPDRWAWITDPPSVALGLLPLALAVALGRPPDGKADPGQVPGEGI